MIETVPVPVGISRFMPAASPKAAPLMSEASSFISTWVPSGRRSKRRLVWMLPPKAAASEMSKTASPFLTWAVAATSVSWMEPAVAWAADSLRSRLSRSAKPVSISFGTGPSAASGVKADRKPRRSSVSKASVPETTGSASVNDRSSAPMPGFLSTVISALSNFTRPAAALTLADTETAPTARPWRDADARPFQRPAQRGRGEFRLAVDKVCWRGWHCR